MMQRNFYTTQDQQVARLKGHRVVLAKNAEQATKQPESGSTIPLLKLLVAGQDNSVSQAIEMAAIELDDMGYGGYGGAKIQGSAKNSGYSVSVCFSINDGYKPCQNRSLNAMRHQYAAGQKLAATQYQADGFNGGAQVALICLDVVTLTYVARDRSYRNRWINETLRDQNLNGKLIFLVTDDVSYDFNNSHLHKFLSSEYPDIFDKIAGAIHLPTNLNAADMVDAMLKQMMPIIHDKAFGYELSPLLSALPREVTYQIASFLPDSNAKPLVITSKQFRLFTQPPEIRAIPGSEANQDKTFDFNECRLF